MTPRRLTIQAFRQTFQGGPVWGRLGPHLIVATLVMLGLVWMATGTLAPLSATDVPRLLPGGCGYTLGTDHGQWVRVFWMLDGRPVGDWGDSIYLRRLLYPLLAYPFYKTFGLHAGGLLVNAALYATMLWAWGLWLLAATGRRGAVAGIWLLATFPGLAYWGGLPYASAAILPVSVFGLILLDRLAARPDLRTAALIGLGLGVLSQAYDLVVYLGPAALFVIAWRRRVLPMLSLMVGLAVPFAVTAGLLWGVFDAPGPGNSNTAVYGAILGAYLDVLSGDVGLAAWATAAAEAPRILVLNLLDSANWVLPVATLALALVGIAGFRGAVRPGAAEGAFALAVLLVFLFNNLAPPYEGWQMRGEWIARLYQPIAVVLIAYAARIVAATVSGPGLARRRRPLAGGIIAVAVAGQAVIVSDGWLGSGEIANLAWYRFYMDKTPTAFLEHRERYGVRPLGYCWKNHPEWPETRPGEV